MPVPLDNSVARRLVVLLSACVGCLLLVVPWGAGQTCHAQDSESEEQLIRRQLDEVLAQPEFSRLRVEPPPSLETPGWLVRFSNWFLDLFPSWKLDPTKSGLLDFLKLVPSILGVILVAGIIFLIIRLVNTWRSRRISAQEKLPSLDVSVGSTPPGELPADEYLRRALLAATNGIFSEAIAQLLLGSLSVTERQGLIRFRKGLTYRDYRRALRRFPPAQEAFQQLCGIYLPVGFGRRQAGRDQFDESLQHYRQVVQSVEAGTQDSSRPSSPTTASAQIPVHPAATRLEP
jgi:hypothetical protein